MLYHDWPVTQLDRIYYYHCFDQCSRLVRGKITSDKPDKHLLTCDTPVTYEY